MSQLNSYMKNRSLDKDKVTVIYSWSHEVDAIAKAKYRWFQCVDSHGPKDTQIFGTKVFFMFL